MAARGARDTDDGEEPVADDAIRETLQKRALWLMVYALIGGAMITLTLFLMSNG